MASTAQRSEKTRLTVDLSDSLNRRLEEIVAETGKSKADVLRMSLDFLLRASEAKREKMIVGAWKDDPENNLRIEREFIGLGHDYQ